MRHTFIVCEAARASIPLGIYGFRLVVEPSRLSTGLAADCPEGCPSSSRAFTRANLDTLSDGSLGDLTGVLVVGVPSGEDLACPLLEEESPCVTSTVGLTSA